MFQRILLPVDGSLSMVPLVHKCLAFAAGIGAHVVVLHVVPVAGAAVDGTADVVADVVADVAADPAQILADVTGQAALLHVPCEGKVLAGAEPWRAILQAAAENGIDLICMGSHGRHGATEYVLASQAMRVLEHAQLPVLLFR